VKFVATKKDSQLIFSFSFLAFGSGMDKNQDPGSQINIPGPQLRILYDFLHWAETRIFVSYFCKNFRENHFRENYKLYAFLPFLTKKAKLVQHVKKGDNFVEIILTT
jgi:hypothetical protein